MRYFTRAITFATLLATAPLIAQTSPTTRSTPRPEEAAVRFLQDQDRERLQVARLELLDARNKIEAQSAQLRNELANTTGHIGGTSQSIRTGLDTLEADRLKLEVDKVGLAARRDALSEAIDKTTAQAAKRNKELNADVAKHLNELVAIRSEQLKVRDQQYKAAVVDAAEVAKARAELEDAKLQLSREQVVVPKSTPELDTVAALNRELLNTSVSLAETVARLEFIENRLHHGEAAIPLLDQMDRLDRERALLDSEIGELRRTELRNR